MDEEDQFIPDYLEEEIEASTSRRFQSWIPVYVGNRSKEDKEPSYDGKEPMKPSHEGKDKEPSSDGIKDVEPSYDGRKQRGRKKKV